MELHGILSGFETWNSIEIHGGFSFMEFFFPWNSIEFFSWNFMEFFHVLPWNLKKKSHCFHGILFGILHGK